MQFGATSATRSRRPRHVATDREPVIDELGPRMPNTLLVLGLATVLSMSSGRGSASSRPGRRGSSATRHAHGQGSLALYSMPEFWLGMIFIWHLRREAGVASRRA